MKYRVIRVHFGGERPVELIASQLTLEAAQALCSNKGHTHKNYCDGYEEEEDKEEKQRRSERRKRYRVIRTYADENIGHIYIKRGLTLEQAQEHCRDPQTSSRTCTDPKAVEHTQKYGVWFDGYEEEPPKHKKKNT